MEAEDRVNKAQLKYDGVHAQREEIDAALKAKGLYPEFKFVSAEKKKADDEGDRNVGIVKQFKSEYKEGTIKNE